MSRQAASYSVIRDFGFQEGESPDRIDMDPYWIVLVVRLGSPLSFSRQKNASVSKDFTQDTVVRSTKPFIITDDIQQIQVQGAKMSHKKQCSFFAKSEINYLVEILPGDWIFSWLTNNRKDHEKVLSLLEDGKQANHFTSGLKFVGRVDSVRKSIDVDPESGTVTSGYSVNCVGFDELDTAFFYDNTLGTRDTVEQNIGSWLTRLGLDLWALFGENTEGGLVLNNINVIVPSIIDLIVGKGPPIKDQPIVGPINPGDSPNSATPQTLNSGPFAYIIPEQAGSILGKHAEAKNHGVLAYADILELMIGVQNYQNKEDWKIFIPELKTSKPCRRITTNQLLGTYLPQFPNFTNKPLWNVLDQWLNPEINERYTCLRVNPDGDIMPTIMFRQIPFTTEAFVPDTGTVLVPLPEGIEGPPGPATSAAQVVVTKFLSLPRWEIPAVMIRHLDVGRSNATRFNFIHIFGSTSYLNNSIPIEYQMLANPPVRDDLDIQKSGLRPYMATVDCWVGDQIGLTAGAWIKLAADRLIGSHLTLNGSVTTVGIQSPICEGDNITLGDGCVYHIQSVSHHAAINASTGKKTWNTTMTLVNGMRALNGSQTDDNENDVATRGTHPAYPGFEISDNTNYNPGFTSEQGRHTTGGLSHRTPHFDPDKEKTDSVISPLNPDGDVEAMFAAPKRRGNSKRK